MPIFPVAPDGAKSLSPAYWSADLPNSSAEFDYAEWCQAGRKQAQCQIKQDTRDHPLPLAPVNVTSELRIAGTTGDVLLFSAAHLHTTAPNKSGVSRFSVDSRTVSMDDLVAGWGAPNVDAKARGTTLGDFLRATDFAPMENPNQVNQDIAYGP